MTSPQPIQVNELPQSIEGFVSLRDQVAQTPWGGAAMMVIALLLYTEDEELGRQCLTVAVDRGRLEKGPNGYQGWQLHAVNMRQIQSQIKARAYVPRSYIKGAAPENGYQLPTPPYVFEFSDNPYSGDLDSGTYKVFILSSGASSPRPVTVKRNNRGIWKAYEWSSLIVGVKEPVQEIEDDL